MKFYRKQPLEAEQFDGSQKLVFGYSFIPSDIIDAITGKPVYYSMLADDVCQDSDDDMGVVLEVGDWIVKEADEIYVIADDVFKQTYQKLPVISMSVDCFITWCKGQNTPLSDALYFESNGFMHSEQDEERIGGWIADHQDEFARAWLDGYQIDNKS